MLKYIYRAIILVGIFVGAIYYFSQDIKEVVFDIDNTTVMEDTTFPLVTLKTGGNVVNLLRGYSSNMNANLIREAVTPLGRDQSYEILINQMEFDIRKMNYELREFSGNQLIEAESVSVFEERGDFLTALIRFNADLIVGREYAVKITLISSNGRKMYFYHRVKVYDNAYLTEKIDFVMEFHEAIRDKNTAETIIRYLEPKRTADNSSLAYVNIHSSFDLITWGNLKPKNITEIVPTVKEIYVDTAIIELDYIVAEEITGVLEYYQVKEFYRVRYTRDRMFLLNYERRMEAFFDPRLASISKNQLKFGISNDFDVDYLSSDNNKRLVFVRGRELWFYNLEENELTRIFSFRQDNTDFIRDIYQEHNIRVLKMDAEGNVDFLVYGYMNRGQYEGRVAVILYQYIHAEKRIEEILYIPIDEPYQTLKENIGDLTYINERDVFYLHIYNNIYAYNLITKEVRVLAQNIYRHNIVEILELNYIAWQESSDPKQSKRIYLLNLESGELTSIEAPDGYNIRLMDKIDLNIIYGYVREEHITTSMDGRLLIPVSKLEIATVNKNILKSYSRSEHYITDVMVRDNMVELSRVRIVNENGRSVFYNTTPDYIMNQVVKETPLIYVTTRVTDFALTELYMTLPRGFNMTVAPTVDRTINTVITQDPTMRVPDIDSDIIFYYPYVMGGIEGAYTNVAEAIRVANENIGVVLNNRQQLVWERGVRATRSTVSGFNNLTLNQATNHSIEGAIELMLSYQGVLLTRDQISVANRSIYEVLQEHSRSTPIQLIGLSLDDVLYYIHMGRPVLAMTDHRNAVIIYGYDNFNITIFDPLINRERKMGLQDSTQMFREAGNVFFSFLE